MVGRPVFRDVPRRHTARAQILKPQVAQQWIHTDFRIDYGMEIVILNDMTEIFKAINILTKMTEMLFCSFCYIVFQLTGVIAEEINSFLSRFSNHPLKSFHTV